jgi:hypothetical protein
MAQCRGAVVGVQVGFNDLRGDAVIVAQELTQARAAMGEMRDMAVDFDAVTGRQDDAVAPLGIVGELFEGPLQRRFGKAQLLAQVDRRGLMAQTNDDDVHR